MIIQSSIILNQFSILSVLISGQSVSSLQSRYLRVDGGPSSNVRVFRCARDHIDTASGFRLASLVHGVKFLFSTSKRENWRGLEHLVDLRCYPNDQFEVQRFEVRSASSGCSIDYAVGDVRSLEPASDRCGHVAAPTASHALRAECEQQGREHPWHPDNS